uniref:G_PROTEIN_RECEP_F1_2 domain-containing protein n=1 Tax=Heterorhabditis bacteriophora TaxID=37862 RepID=A0A1I7X334_HETBA
MQITYAYIAPIIITCGIIGDVLTVITLTHPLLRKSSIIYTYLTLLAMTDLANALMGASVWIVVFLTLSQYMAVCRPFAYGLRSRKICFMLFALAYIFNFFIYAPWAVKKEVHNLKRIVGDFALGFANDTLKVLGGLKQTIIVMNPTHENYQRSFI